MGASPHFRVCHTSSWIPDTDTAIKPILGQQVGHHADLVAVVPHLVCKRLLMLRSVVFGPGEISATMLGPFALYRLRQLLTLSSRETYVRRV